MQRVAWMRARAGISWVSHARMEGQCCALGAAPAIKAFGNIELQRFRRRESTRCRRKRLFRTVYALRHTRLHRVAHRDRLLSPLSGRSTGPRRVAARRAMRTLAVTLRIGRSRPIPVTDPSGARNATRARSSRSNSACRLRAEAQSGPLVCGRCPRRRPRMRR